MEADQCVVVSIERCHNVKTVSDTVKLKGVIKREFDNLTNEEIKLHQKQVDQAKLEELKRWHDLKCFTRMPRSQARNKVDGTWFSSGRK